MDADFTKTFEKQFKKLPVQKQKKVRNTIKLFLEDIYSPSLRNHVLKDKWLGYYSISAGGDLRLHLKVINQNKVLFVAVGNHSQLYK